MQLQNPQELFHYDLCVMYNTEQQLTQILPTLAQEAQNDQAREAFLQHEQETRQHVRNIEQCFQIIGKQPMQTTEYAVAGLKQDHDTFLQQQPASNMLTIFDIESAAKSEYLEMAAYHNLIASADLLGYQKCVPLLQQNLQQEEAAAQKLARLALQLGKQAVSSS
jgi:ferritin-like metal-binding protein YciE